VAIFEEALLQSQLYSTHSSVVEFIDIDWEDKVKSGIGLSYRPARLRGLAGWYDNPMPQLTLSMNSATE
jgi:hypothetical protein